MRAQLTVADAPVFIGGLSYSGKTQLRQMLEPVPDLSLVRRTKLWEHHGAFGDLRLAKNRARARIDLASLQEFQGSLRPDWDKVFEEFETGEFSYARLFGIVHRQHAESVGCARWGEQYGGIVRFAHDIFASFPEAKMIHMMRHPRGRLSRMSDQPRRRGWVGRETAAGIASLQLARAHTDAHPDGYMVLSYEQLSRDPVSALKTVCEFIDEPAQPVIRSGVIDEIRFDDQRELQSDTPLVIREFASAAQAYWERPESVHGIMGIGLDAGMLARFPVDSLALLYGINAPKRGRPE